MPPTVHITFSPRRLEDKYQIIRSSLSLSGRAWREESELIQFNIAALKTNSNPGSIRQVFIKVKEGRSIEINLP